MTARVIGFPKPHTFRSETLRRAVASLPCVECGREGATQAAHANQGKGGAIKASDALIAALCTECHHAIDAGSKMTKAERRAYEFEVIAKTYAALIERGLLTVNKGAIA